LRVSSISQAYLHYLSGVREAMYGTIVVFNRVITPG
jgi:hypothetical protein